MFQDIAPHTYKNEYQNSWPKRDSILVYFKDKKVLLCKEGSDLRLPRFSQLEAENDDLYENDTYLFTIDDDAYYLVNYINYDKSPGLYMESVQSFHRELPGCLSFAGITAFQLFNWYENHRYCGRCGKPMQKDEKERMLYCSKCGNIEYPKICPAVIVGITDGNRLLMSKYAGRDYKKYALLAGFAEVGESIEDTVRREVMEEVGLKVKNIRYYKSQPWSFSDSLLLGFYADLDGSSEITLDEEELALAEWFEREDIPAPDNSFSLTSELIINFICGGEKA